MQPVNPNRHRVFVLAAGYAIVAFPLGILMALGNLGIEVFVEAHLGPAGFYLYGLGWRSDEWGLNAVVLGSSVVCITAVGIAAFGIPASRLWRVTIVATACLIWLIGGMVGPTLSV